MLILGVVMATRYKVCQVLSLWENAKERKSTSHPSHNPAITINGGVRIDREVLTTRNGPLAELGTIHMHRDIPVRI